MPTHNEKEPGLFESKKMQYFVLFFICLVPFLFCLLPCLIQVSLAWACPNAYLPLSELALLSSILLNWLCVFFIIYFIRERLPDLTGKALLLTALSQVITLYGCAVLYYAAFVLFGEQMKLLIDFPRWVSLYKIQYSLSAALYFIFLWGWALVFIRFSKHKEGYTEFIKKFIFFNCILQPFFWLGIPEFFNILTILVKNNAPTTPLIYSSSTYTIFLLGCFLNILMGVSILYAITKKEKNISLIWMSWSKKIMAAQGVTLVLLITGSIIKLYQCIQYGLSLEFGMSYLIKIAFYNKMLACAGLFLLALIFLFIRKSLKAGLFSPKSSKKGDSSGQFGSADWATTEDLQHYNLYDIKNNYLSGLDGQGRPLYLPLQTKLTISPQGGGKSSTSSIPILLSYEGSVLVFDAKGDLWAVTARYRSEVLKRKVVVIDPFNIRMTADFKKGKSEELLKKYTMNPFDWIPQDQNERDRMINNLAASFIINEGGSIKHFDDNAKILIRGYIDYMVRHLPKEARNLKTLFNLLSEDYEQAKLTFDQMSQLPGRASAAANQINRVGADERGSILSTSYRQIDWISDINVQETLLTSNFDLADFTKGDMDIFVIIPEDQTAEHSRLFRMIMALLMGIIIRVNPSDLPNKKMLFLLEELAQLGYTPDVEKCIEVLRARNVIVWTVFQTLSQIECFEKPDLFKGSKIKQIFTNDDIATMEWIQKLAGKKTIMTKTMSTNSGDNRQKMQWFGGSVSTGEGESIHETGVDLIPLNEIRELATDQQYIFVHSMKPIRCRKIPYFQYPEFAGRYDDNPLENSEKGKEPPEKEGVMDLNAKLAEAAVIQ